MSVYRQPSIPRFPWTLRVEPPTDTSLRKKEFRTGLGLAPTESSEIDEPVSWALGKGLGEALELGIPGLVDRYGPGPSRLEFEYDRMVEVSAFRSCEAAEGDREFASIFLGRAKRLARRLAVVNPGWGNLPVQVFFGLAEQPRLGRAVILGIPSGSVTTRGGTRQFALCRLV